MPKLLTQPPLVLEFVRIAYLLFPLLGGGLLQGLCMRYAWLHVLRRPVDLGLKFRGRRIFGEHKTFQGFVSAGVGSSIFAVLQTEVLHRYSMLASLEYFDYATIHPLAFGFFLGIAGIVSELPNSFVKRQLGIAPGAHATGIGLGLFYFMDQVDVLLGVWLYLSTLMEVTVTQVVVSITFVFVIHQVITLVGYVLGMRKTLH